MGGVCAEPLRVRREQPRECDWICVGRGVERGRLDAPRQLVGGEGMGIVGEGMQCDCFARAERRDHAEASRPSSPARATASLGRRIWVCAGGC